MLWFVWLLNWQLAGTEHEKSLALLKLFAWGTYQDYKGVRPGKQSDPDSSQRGEFTIIKPPANREITSSHPRLSCL